MPEKTNQVWLQIIEIHNHTKALFLLAEEICPEFKDFIQPNNELKHTLEHIIRSKASELNVSEKKFEDDEKEKYIANSYNKALGHEYRAFFDSADWISVNFRSKILEILKPYSAECITHVLPSYYSEDRRRIDEINKKIANIRSSKDIVNSGKLGEINDYLDILGELEKIYTRVRDSVSALQEYKSKEDNKENKIGRKNKLWGFILVIISVLFAYFLGSCSKVNHNTACANATSIKKSYENQ